MAEYVFTFKVIASDREGYYYDDWSKATRYEVVGATKKHALDALWPILGEAPRGRFWKARQVGTTSAVSTPPEPPREDVTASGVAALRMAADNMPLGRSGQPWEGATEWLHRRADEIEKHVITPGERT